MTIGQSAKMCPFCQQDNACQVETPSACWCTNVVMPAELINALPAALKHKHCICSACLAAYQADAKQFLKHSGLS